MSIRRASTTASFTLFMVACAPVQLQQPPGAAAPQPASRAQAIAQTEKVGFQGEREINAAERELEELRPDQAVVHLEAAARSLGDAQIESYPEARQLRERHSALVARVPRVREEIRRRELAAEVARAEEQIDQARARAKDAVAQLQRKAAGDEDVRYAEESLALLQGSVEASTKLEDRDTGYAKYSLAARKELAHHKTAMDKRKLELAVAQDRQEIARVTGELASALARIAARDAAAEDFDRARSAADEVQKMLATAGSRAAKDARFAQHVAQVKERLAAQRASIDARRHAVSVLAQRDRVEEARKVLSRALDGLKARSADDVRFQEAESAVATVEKTIGEGAALAAKDGGYASYASEVKKRMAEARTRIAARKVEVAVAEQRAQIASARGTMSSALGGLKSGQPSNEQLDAARGTIGAVEKALDGAEALARQDRDLAKLVMETRKSLPGARAFIEQRKLDVEVAQQRARVEAAREALAAAMRPIDRADVAEAELGAAEEAAHALAAALDGGEALVSRDRRYGSYALDVSKRVEASSTRIAARRVEVAVARHQAEIGVARSALDAAMARISERYPEGADFAAAREAVGAVEKTLDGAEAVTAKDREFSRYVLDARKALSPVRSQIDQRELQVEIAHHQARVEQALASLSESLGAMTGEAEVNAADSAVAALEKTLADGDEYGARSADYSKFSLASMKTAFAARKQIRERREEIVIQGHKDAVEGELVAVRSAMEGMDDSAASFQAANEAIARARKALDGKAAVEDRLPRYAIHAIGARKELAAASTRVAQRKTELAVREQRGLVDAAVEGATSAVGAAQAPDATSAEIAAATAALRSAREALVKGAALEKADAGYLTFALGTRKQLDKALDELDTAKHTVAFREGPLAALAAGMDAVASAEQRPAGEQKEALVLALEQFRTCQRSAASIVADEPKLASTLFAVGRNKAKGSTVISACAQQIKSLEAKLGAVARSPARSEARIAGAPSAEKIYP